MLLGLTITSYTARAALVEFAPTGTATAVVDDEGRDNAARRADRSDRSDAAADETNSGKKADWVLPMRNAELTSCFGPRWGTVHEGIDLARKDAAPILAVGAGEVVKAGDVSDGYGISVFVDHGNGYLTQYAHMSKTVVQVGQLVGPGTVLGHQGSTGDSTGPHLHFEVHQGMWNQIEPAQWLRDHGVQVGC